MKVVVPVVPCLFYPVTKKHGVSISQLLSDSKTQANLLIDISQNYPVNAVMRMTELWCEGASFGVPCEITDDDFPKLGEPIYTDVNKLEDVKTPQIENEVTEPLINGVRLAVPHLDKPLIVGVTGPYTLASVLNGSENFMMNCMMAPDQVHGFLNKITEYLIDYVSAYKSVGSAGVILAEPSASMVSPEMMAQFSNVYIQKIIKEVQDDSFSIIYHNCGSVNKHLETISHLDVDAFHFGNEVDLSLAFDLIDKNKFIMGNIDPRLFITSTPDIIEEKTIQLIQNYGRNDNFILSTGCDLSPDASIENLERFFTMF